MIIALKNQIEKIPYSLGRFVSKAPYSWKLGKTYTNFRVAASDYLNASDEMRKVYAIKRFSEVFNHAKKKLPFYQEFYRRHGVSDLQINSLEDIKTIPILTKADIRDYTKNFRGKYKINTGGTSGEPFSFWLDKRAWAREWAHLHYIWGLKSYSCHDLKITLRGKNLGDRPYVYNSVHNEFVINTYLSSKKMKIALLEIFSKYPIKYIHGYPSAIYSVFSGIEPLLTKMQKASISKAVRSCFFGSEYPHAPFVDYLKTKWNFDYISWYGHSEMCILAYDEFSDNRYRPFLTYGLTEVIGGRLIGTSYHNKDMPLIRYDTGDLVSAEYADNGLVERFSVEQGRVGDFVTDRHGVQIPLTGLVFGRHHKAFNVADYVQVGQEPGDGVVTIYVTAKNIETNKTKDLFDLSNVDQDFIVKFVDAPVLTKAGKFQLKLSLNE